MSRINVYLLAFGAINLLQAACTPILGDEAYYWLYAQQLDFGYFDHPPLVALMIKIGTALFSDTLLGVRFLTVILSVATARLIWSLIPDAMKKTKHAEGIFLLLLCSIPVFNLYGFVTTPDVPLLFFSAFFLWTAERFLKQKDILQTAVLGVSMAFLIYSKYHGGIVILITLLVRYELLKQWKTYAAGVLALLLLVPHVLWQVQHDFITFDYHLFQRDQGQVGWRNIGDYLGGTFAVLNPIGLLVLGVVSYRNKKFRDEHRSWIWLLWGFLFFFLLYAWRSKVEVHWVAFASLPVLILLYSLMASLKRLPNWAWVACLFSLCCTVVIRVVLVLNVPLETEFHAQQKDYFHQIASLADGRKVVFANSYQRAAKYAFYTGEQALSDNNAYYRKNQYDLLDQAEFHNQEVLFVQNWPGKDTLITLKGESAVYRIIQHYPVFNRIKGVLKGELESLDKKGSMTIQVENPYPYPIDLRQQTFWYNFSFFLKNKTLEKMLPVQMGDVKVLPPMTTTELEVSWELPEEISDGDYVLQLVLGAGNFSPKVISKKYKVKCIQTSNTTHTPSTREAWLAI